jgi:hypothetical protein
MRRIITPTIDCAATLAAKRADFSAQVERQAHRERAIVAGTATMAMIDAAIAEKHLSRVLAGPVPFFYNNARVGSSRRGDRLPGNTGARGQNETFAIHRR